MSNKPNPTSIGLFIVAGLALGVTGLLLFGSSRLFTRTVEYIVYFDSSLNGLSEGAPVKYRGVTIGSVQRVMIRFNQAVEDTSMPVIIEIRDDLVRDRWMGHRPFRDLEDVRAQIKGGLRASLETESLVTGVLYISLEIQPDPPPAIFHQINVVYPEIPSRPTEIQQLLRNLSRLDVAGLNTRLNNLITRIDTSLNDLQLSTISEGITNLLTSLNRVVGSPHLTNAFADVRRTLEEYRWLASKLRDRVDPLADGLTNTLAQADTALAQIRSGVENLGDLLAPDSALRHELTIALERLADAAQSISVLAEFLEDNPNSLITGRRAPVQ